MNNYINLNTQRSVIGNTASFNQSPLQGQLYLGPVQTQSIRTPFLEEDTVFMKLLKIGIVDECGIVQKGKFHIQEFFNQKLDVRKLEGLSLRQFIQMIFNEIKNLPKAQSIEASDIFLSGKSAWKLLKRSGVLDDVMENLDFIEALIMLQDNSTASDHLEILVCIEGTENLASLKNAILYEINHRECVELSENPFEFSFTSFEMNPQSLTIPLVTDNGSSIILKIISHEEFNKNTTIKISLNSNEGDHPIQFNSRNLWQILINRLIGVPTINFKQPMDFIRDLTEGRRPLDSNLSKIKVGCEAITTLPSNDINRLYAIAFQTCVLSQPSKDACKAIWKEVERSSDKLQNQNDVNRIFTLMKVLILDHNVPFNYILALFVVAGYIHQYTDQENLIVRRSVSFALTGDENGVLLQLQFDAKDPCYAILGLDLVWVLHEIEQGRKHVFECAQTNLVAFYELLLPLRSVQQRTDFPALQWLPNCVLDLNKVQKMFDEDRMWPINHLGMILQCIDNIQKNELSALCCMLEYLPKLLSKQMTVDSCEFLLESFNQVIAKYFPSVELREGPQVMGKSRESQQQCFFKWIVNCFLLCNDKTLFQTFKKMWMQETSRENTLNKEMEKLGVQLVRSLTSVGLTLEAINLYLHLCRKGNLETQISLNFLSTLFASVRMHSTTINPAVYCMKLGEGIKLLLKSLESKSDTVHLPKSVSWIISELIEMGNIPLVNEIMNYAQKNEKVTIDDLDNLKAKLLPFNCKEFMSEETVGDFLAIHQEEVVKDGELWLHTLNFAEKLKEETRTTLINAWVVSEIHSFIVYPSAQTRKECWMVILNYLKDIPECDIVDLYKSLGKLVEHFAVDDKQIRVLVKKALSILYRQLPLKPDEVVLESLRKERNTSANDQKYFNEIEKPLIILLCHSKSNKLQLKGLTYFLEWIEDVDQGNLHQAYSNTVLEIFQGIMHAEGDVESLHDKLFEIVAKLRENVGSLPHFVCAEKCLLLSSFPEAHDEALDLVLEGLDRHELSNKLTKYNKKIKDKGSNARFNFNKVVNDEHLYSALNLLLDNIPLIVDPNRMFKLLAHKKISDLINAKSFYLLWSKYFTQLDQIFTSPGCSDEKEIGWNKHILNNLGRIEGDPELFRKHFECYMDRMFSNLLKNDTKKFTKVWIYTSDIFVKDIDECNDPELNKDSNNRRVSMYLSLYVKLFRRCIKGLESFTDSKHSVCLYNACEKMMSKVVELSSNSVLFKCVEIPYQEFLLWRPKERPAIVFQEHISNTFYICKNALKDHFLHKKQALANKLIPAVFDHLFNFISQYPHVKGNISDWYDESKEIIEFLLKNKVLSKESLESILNKLILFAPFAYGLFDKDISIEIRDLNWLDGALDILSRKRFVSASDARIFKLCLAAELHEEKPPLKYEVIKDIFIGLLNKFSSYPNYSLAIRSTLILSKFQPSLQPKDFATCLDKLQSGVSRLPSNLMTTSLLVDLCGITKVLISKYPIEKAYKYPHDLVFSLVKQQLNVLNDVSDPLTNPNNSVGKALSFLIEICKYGTYLDRWSELYTIFQFMRIVFNAQEAKDFHFNFVDCLSQCSSGYLTNPQEQLQRAEFFVLCLEDIASTNTYAKAACIVIDYSLKQTEIFKDHLNLLEKY